MRVISKADLYDYHYNYALRYASGRHSAPHLKNPREMLAGGEGQLNRHLRAPPPGSAPGSADSARRRVSANPSAPSACRNPSASSLTAMPGLWHRWSEASSA